ncbi:uncharacterized protein LOC119181374 isoform X3 [Rhipicephalus microplus]|uniref:uncharacterized protein LOC119181374 isoform X3 n=1 Tax=Rhipicephalus microplus TaxID=6941 RepID=UPI003F6BEF21
MATYHCPDGSMARNAPYTEDVTCADVKQEFTMPNSPPPLLSLVTESVDIKVEPSSPETVLPLNMTCDDIEEEISLVTDCVDIKVEPASSTTMLATERLDMIDREPSESSALQPRSIVVTPPTGSAEISSEVSSMESNLRIPGCAPAVPATLGEQFQQVNPSGHQRTYEAIPSVCVKVEQNSPRTPPPRGRTCANGKQEFIMPNHPPPLLSLVVESVDIKTEPSSPNTVLPPDLTCDDIKKEIEMPHSPERLDVIDKKASELPALRPCNVVLTPLTWNAERPREVLFTESNLRVPGCTPAVPVTLAEQFQQANLSAYLCTDEVKVQCSQCSAMLANKRSLQDHMLTHSSERPYECDTCGTRFKRKGSLVRHHAIHTAEKEFKCELCPSAFYRKESLEKHKELHERGVDLFPCQECGRIFRQNESLLKHLRRHTLEKPFACHLCPAKFLRQADLNVHMRKHTGERPYKCSICEKSFSQPQKRTMHMRRTHLEVKLKKTFPCSACEKVFFDQRNLRRHEGTHEIKIFQCSHCSVTVASMWSLKRHMMTHSSERPHKCGTCGMRFKRMSGLLSHRTTHMVEKKFKCEQCPSTFCKKVSLKRHKEFHERGVNRFHCQECGRTFLLKKSLQRHQRSHMLERPFACRLCPAKFFRKHHWETHMLGHTDKKSTQEFHL